MSIGAWTQVFRKSSIGPDVYVLHETDQLDADKLEKVLLAAGAWISQRGSLYDATLRAAAVPGGAVFRVIHGYGIPGLPEKLWVIGPWALRHVLRLMDIDPPKRRLSTEADEIPTAEQLEAEWLQFSATPAEKQIGASLPWLRLTGSKDLDQVRSASPVTFPVVATENQSPTGPSGDLNHLLEFGPEVREGWFWKGSVHAEGPAGRRRVTADGLSAE